MEKVFLTYSEYVALKDLFIPSTLRAWLRHWSASTSADLMWQSWDWSRWKLQTSKTGNEIQITADSLYKSASGGLAYWNKPLTQEVPIGVCGFSGGLNLGPSVCKAGMLTATQWNHQKYAVAFFGIWCLVLIHNTFPTKFKTCFEVKLRWWVWPDWLRSFADFSFPSLQSFPFWLHLATNI